MPRKSEILAEPLQPGGLRICLKCGRWFALTFEMERPDELLGEIRVYRCQYCNAKVEFAESLPKGVI